MLSPAADQLLSNVEAKLEEVSRAVAGQDAQALERACAELRHGMQLFAHGWAQLAPKQRQQASLCVKRIQALLGNQRGGVARQSARVELALQAIMPASRSSTYGNAKSPYGTGVTQTGAFKLLAA